MTEVVRPGQSDQQRNAPSDGSRSSDTLSVRPAELADGSDRLDVVFIGFLLGHGGDAMQMLALADGVQRTGARVGVIVPANEHTITFRERCNEAGVSCERSELLVADMQGTRQRLGSLIRLLRSIDAPIVHFHTGNSLLPRSVMIALELLRFRRTFVTLQSPYETIDHSSSRARFWSVAGRRRFQAVVSPSDHGTAFQRQCGIPMDLAVTIRNSVDIAAIRNGDASGPRAMLGVEPDSPVVLFSSRIDQQKRPVDAVRAFARVAHEHPAALLVFLGSGDEEVAVRDAVAEASLEDRVRLVGYQTNISDWLAAATVWILPTERENFSVAVLEALAAGCPVLSTPCRGNDEVLIDGENALLFPIGDVEAAASGLNRLLHDGSLRHGLAAAGRTTADQFSVDVMMERYLELYLGHPDAPAALRS